MFYEAADHVPQHPIAMGTSAAQFCRAFKMAHNF